MIQDYIDELKLLRHRIKELDVLITEYNDSQKKLYENVFVVNEMEHGLSHFRVTKAGFEELEKYSIKVVRRSYEYFWSSKGMETIDCTGCFICHDENICSSISYGYAPRFVSCAKHSSFLVLAKDLQRNENL